MQISGNIALMLPCTLHEVAAGTEAAEEAAEETEGSGE